MMKRIVIFLLLVSNIPIAGMKKEGKELKADSKRTSEARLDTYEKQERSLNELLIAIEQGCYSLYRGIKILKKRAPHLPLIGEQVVNTLRELTSKYLCTVLRKFDEEQRLLDKMALQNILNALQRTSTIAKRDKTFMSKDQINGIFHVQKSLLSSAWDKWTFFDNCKISLQTATKYSSTWEKYIDRVILKLNKHLMDYEIS